MGIEHKHAYRFGYLKSEEWRGVRLEALARDGAACRVCGKVNWFNDAHHKRYPRNIWKTTPDDLITLCRECHDGIHGIPKTYIRDLQWGETKRKVLMERGFLSALRCNSCRNKPGEIINSDAKRPTVICRDCRAAFDAHRIANPEKSIWRAVDAARNAAKATLLHCIPKRVLDGPEYPSYMFDSYQR